jgi:hypothetical protein
MTRLERCLETNGDYVGQSKIHFLVMISFKWHVSKCYMGGGTPDTWCAAPIADAGVDFSSLLNSISDFHVTFCRTIQILYRIDFRTSSLGKDLRSQTRVSRVIVVAANLTQIATRMLNSRQVVTHTEWMRTETIKAPKSQTPIEIHPRRPLMSQFHLICHMILSLLTSPHMNAESLMRLSFRQLQFVKSLPEKRESLDAPQRSSP